MVWTILELLKYATGYLAEKGLAEPRPDAERLLADALGMKRLDLYLQFDRPLKPEELAEFKPRLLRRARHEPLQYIAGSTDFRELRLRVDRRALIPRPETEQLVGAVLAWAEGRSALSALDVGTGTGAVALGLATEGPFERVVATDLSAEALSLARENHAAAAPGAPVEFREGAGYAPVAGERFDVVVSNPPYIALGERPELERQVSEWEPEMALFSGETGLEVVEALVRGAPDHLLPGGLLALEIGAGQGAAVLEIARGVPTLADARVQRDYAGRDRILLSERTRPDSDSDFERPHPGA